MFHSVLYFLKLVIFVQQNVWTFWLANVVKIKISSKIKKVTYSFAEKRLVFKLKQEVLKQ